MRRTLIVVSLVSLALFPRSSRSQISPGPLSNAHRALEGVGNCFKCHEKGAGVSDSKCLECHTEIEWLKARGRGLHAKLQNTACAKCHPDHAGRDFDLVRWEEGSPEKFDHRRAGFVLEGRHDSLECRKCHVPRLQKSGATALMRQKDHARSWLGMERACAACHADPHSHDLGNDCQNCHAQTAWKPARGFDHAKSKFALSGKHVTTACASCHTGAKGAGGGAASRPAAEVPAGSLRFKTAAFADCAPCHKDAHAGRFAGNCSRCHNPQSFHQVDKRNFDHDRTRFALKGKHGELECAKCHDRKTAWGERPQFARCMSCHKDAHGGQGLLAGKPADCSGCHNEKGWLPATYPLAAHQASSYPLEGRHLKAACAGCHTRGATPADLARLGSSRVLIRPGHAVCTECHADPHQGRFAVGGRHAQRDGCRACHTMQGFVPAMLSMAEHTAYGYALDGAHRAVPCLGCHTDLKAPRPASTLKGVREPAIFVSDTPTACAGCHQTPHGDQFAGRKSRLPKIAGDACDACHGLDAFAPAARFDHDRDAAFKLGGAHAKVACAQCHRKVRGARGQMIAVYRPLPSRCEDCHTVQKGPGGNIIVSRPSPRTSRSPGGQP
ncbi:MAG: hypothetical protein HZB25_14390 [Candidatus Eisenbacteria bacterium]|nr:hypothetical protein [Candidatus Eisenbacteria bacterium]